MIQEPERTAIQNGWYKTRDKYAQLADELHRLLDKDQRFPHGSVYTVKHRLKSERRLLEKLDNATPTDGVPINAFNFHEHIADLLGLRIICLRVSDLQKIQEYLTQLQAENALLVLEGPIQKETFVLRPSKELFQEREFDLQYSGYSSIHYVVRLGPSVKTPQDLQDTRAELQVRTILEEAWGEIDHKYRYELKRSGKAVPSSVESGFRDLALYLQAAARHAEHLCEEMEELIRADARPVNEPGAESAIVVDRIVETPTIPAITPPREAFRLRLGFEPTPRTQAYCLRRIDEHNKRNGWTLTILDILTENVIEEFKAIYHEALNTEPFTPSDTAERDLDVVALINFALFKTIFPEETIRTRLRHVLMTRSSTRSDVVSSHPLQE
jgi:ppGpp synthetase/RelA/SpoT-type nucleotidyltranferase